MADREKDKDKEEGEPNLRGLYGAVQSAIWLVGLAILFWTGYWFPGILILVAISGVTQALLSSMASRQEQKVAEQAALAASAAQCRHGRATQLPHLWGSHQRWVGHLDRSGYRPVSLLQGGDPAEVWDCCLNLDLWD